MERDDFATLKRRAEQAEAEIEKAYAALETGGYKLGAHDRLPEKILNLCTIASAANDTVRSAHECSERLKKLLSEACTIMKTHRYYKINEFLTRKEIANLTTD